jgi:hypothetical protein
MAVPWSSESPTERAVRKAILLTGHRPAYVHQHGQARTLRDMLAQECVVMARSGCLAPRLDSEEIDYTREAIRAHLDANDKRTAIECLFGDNAGSTLRCPPAG